VTSQIRTILFLSVVGITAVSCSKKDNAEETPAPPPATTEAPAKPQEAVASIDAAAAVADVPDEAKQDEVDLAEWEQYWPEFQKAIAAKDLPALRKLTQVGDGNDEIDEGTFTSLGDTFLTAEVLELVAKTDAAKIAVSKSEPDVREFSWSETEMVDGEEMGTGLFFYFKKVDGKYRLFRLLAAG
jgi:hypothetical protein